MDNSVGYICRSFA